jgi:hypothetical protein
MSFVLWNYAGSMDVAQLVDDDDLHLTRLGRAWPPIG